MQTADLKGRIARLGPEEEHCVCAKVLQESDLGMMEGKGQCKYLMKHPA